MRFLSTEMEEVEEVEEISASITGGTRSFNPTFHL